MKTPQFRLIHDREENKKIEFTLSGFYLDKIKIDRKDYSIVNVPSVTKYLKEGYPSLPRLAKSIIISDDSRMTIRIIDKDVQRMKVSPVAPSKGNLYRNVDPASIPYTFSNFYNSNEIFPEEIVTLSDPFILRDFRGITVYFNPIRYDAGKGEIEIVKRIVVEIFSAGVDEVNVGENSTTSVSNPFKNLYDDFFINYSESRYDTLNEHAGRMIIICADDYLEEMDSLLLWKRKKGIKTDLFALSQIGNNETSIKNFIKNQYDGEGVTFCLLVGDGDELTPATGTLGTASGKDADPVYSYIEGDDNYSDLFISRFSSDGHSITNIRNQVMRSIKYERNPQDGEDWYQWGLGVASNQTGGTGIMDKERMDCLRDTLLMTIEPYFTYTSLDSSYGPWGTSSIIANAINEGRSIINYIGHGSVSGWSNGGGFHISNINNLTNYWKLPLIISVACQIGNFNGNNCYCEASVDAGTLENPTGFITHWGSTINQSWVPPTVGQEGAVNLLAHYRANTAGGIYFNGASYMIEKYGGSSQEEGVEMAQTWHIFGDASLSIRTDKPDTLEVTYNPTVPPTPYDLTVIVKDNDGITPVENALVGLYLPEDNLLESGYTNSSGEITLTINPSSSVIGEYISVTVTSFNYKPFIDSILVKSPALWTIKPESVQVNTSTSIHVEVEDTSGLDYPGVEIHIYGYGFESHDTTDVNGEVMINVYPEYGETLFIVGRDTSKTWNLFSDILPVYGASNLKLADIDAFSDTINVIGGLMPDIRGVVWGSTLEDGFTLYLTGCGIDTSQYTTNDSVMIELIPINIGNLLGVIAKNGYNIYQEYIPVEIYRGWLSGYVQDASTSVPIVGARIKGYKYGVDTTSNDPDFNMVSGSGGLYITDLISCGDYDIYTTALGYQPSEEVFTVKSGHLHRNIAMYDLSGIAAEDIPLVYSMKIDDLTTGSHLNIRYSLPERARVKFKIYDCTGRKVKNLTITNGAGWYKEGINTNGLSSGVYYIIMEMNSTQFTKKTVLIK